MKEALAASKAMTPQTQNARCELNVISKIKHRQALGLSKYGVTMERRDLSTLDWLIHAQEEALDLAIYLEKLIQNERP